MVSGLLLSVDGVCIRERTNTVHSLLIPLKLEWIVKHVITH